MVVKAEPIVSEYRVDLDKNSVQSAKQEVRKFARDTGKLLDPVETRRLELNVGDAKIRLDELRKELKQVGNDVNRKRELIIQTDRASRNLTEARRQLRNYENTGNKAVSRLQRKFDGIGGSILKNLINPFTLAAGAIFGLRRAFQETTDTAIEFESAFAGVGKTIDGVSTRTGELTKIGEQLKQEFIDLSTEIPVSFEELSKIGELGGQLGVARGDILDFTETIAKIAVTTDLTEEAAATSFARIANILQIPIENVGDLASVVVELGNGFATTESQIVEFTNRLASAGKVAGVTPEDIAAISTALSSVGINAEAGGTAVSKALLDINEAVVSGGTALSGFAETAGLSVDEFRTLREQDAGAAFESFVNGLGEQGDVAVGTIDELLGSNVRTKNAFLSLANAGDLLSDTLSVAAEEISNVNALEDEAAKRFGTTESQAKILNNQLDAQKELIGRGLLPIKLAFRKAIVAVVTALNKFGGALKSIASGQIFDKWLERAKVRMLNFGIAVQDTINRVLRGFSKLATKITGVEYQVKQLDLGFNRVKRLQGGGAGSLAGSLNAGAGAAENLKTSFEDLGDGVGDLGDDIEGADEGLSGLGDGLSLGDKLEEEYEEAEKILEDFEKSSRDSRENIADDIEKSVEKVGKLEDKIQDVNDKLAELDQEETGDIAGRFVKAQEELQKLEADIINLQAKDKTAEGLSASEQVKLVDALAEEKKLREEIALAESLTTEQERAVAEEIAGESEVEKIIRETEEKRQELLKQIDDLEQQKADELAIQNDLIREKEKVEKLYTLFLGEEIKAREQLEIESLKRVAEARKKLLSLGAESGSPSGTVNNTSTADNRTQVNNITLSNEQEAADFIKKVWG